MTTAITQSQIRRIHAVKRARGITDETYRTVLAQWGAESSKELTAAHAEQVIRCLAGARDKKADPCDHLRKRLIAMSYSIGEDVQFVKGWCEKYGVKKPGGNTVRKPFNGYTAQELMGLAEKFRKVIEDRQRAVTDIGKRQKETRYTTL